MRPAHWMVAAGLLVAAGCSDDGGDDSSGGTSVAPPVTICEPSGTAQPEEQLPEVEEVAAAVAAVEAELGAPAEYFEVNATSGAVNLFVALNEGTMAQQYIWVDGELTPTAAQPAQGGTFTAEEMEFDAAAVLSTIRSELPDTVLETFYVNGDGQGVVKYAVLAAAQCGGGLDIVVGPDGAILSVDPL